LDRGPLIGIIGGLLIFVLALSFIVYSHSDFDGQLIEQVDKGVPSNELIPQIDKETQKMQINSKRRLESIVMDEKYWGNGNLAQPVNYEYYTNSYESEMKVISDYDSARKSYAKREINKEQFLSEIKGPREYFKIYST